MVICPDCGKDVCEDKFCRNCGAYISNIKEIETVENNTEDENLPELAEPAAVEIKKINFCYNCGCELAGDYKFCPECGRNLSRNVTDSHKNILLAVILSVVLPGLGQIYLRLDHKGSIFLIAYVVSVILVLLLIGFVLAPIVWIWALVDTIISANAMNRGEEVKDKIL